MNCLQAIASRRSICGFRPDPIDRDEIVTIPAAAVATPSAKDSQPWRFAVVRGALGESTSHV